MRWHVYGTDAGTGQDVLLALDEQEATHAVQTAMAKRILVSHVTREAGEGLRRVLLPFAWSAAIALLALCIALYVQGLSTRTRLNQAVAEQGRLAQIAAQAESLASQIRQGTPASTAKPLSEETSRQLTILVEQLASARTRAAQAEQQLNTTYQQMTALDRVANEVPSLRSRLKSETEALQRSVAEVVRLGEERALQQRRLEELASLPPDPAIKKLAQAEATNKELASQVELLKSQLLVAAATSSPSPPANSDTASSATGPAPSPTRWAMLTSYDNAADFLRLYFDKETLRSVPTADGAVASSGTKLANAASLRLLHNRAGDRVYSGTLTVSLVADGPREKVAENSTLATEFLRTFAPSCEKPEAAVAAAVAHLKTVADGGQRWVLVGSDYKLTVWRDAKGATTFKAESPRVDFED